MIQGEMSTYRMKIGYLMNVCKKETKKSTKRKEKRRRRTRKGEREKRGRERIK
jgi:hypothetical protein